MERNVENTKQLMKRNSVNCKLKKYKGKNMPSEVYAKLDEESWRWIQCNIEPKKVASNKAVQEQMVETRTWKANRGLPVERDKCKIRRQAKETLMHWL